MTVFVPGNRVDLLRTGDEYFPALEAAIAAARREVRVEPYIFEDDPTGRRVAQALADAARRGVAVRVLVDGFGAANLVASIRGILEPAGVRVLVYRPEGERFRFRRHRLRRLHRKLVVVDGDVGFCGGINLVDDRDGRGEGAPRFDFAVRVAGPIVADMQLAVRRLWALVEWSRSGRIRAGFVRPEPPPEAFADGRRAAFVARDSLRSRRGIEDAYLDAIRGARSEILIANAYFLPGRRFRRALRDASERGVRVRLLLQGVPDHLLVHYATRALYGSLIDAGIEIHEYVRAHLHAKVAVVDGRWATVGSSNIDPFSLLLSREANVVVDDAAFADALRQSLESAIHAESVTIVHETWSRQPWTLRVASWLAFQSARVLRGLTGFGRDDAL